ncbi:DUF6249 domain-containing protein [Solimicrobium silvestre]|uniref:DUF6249 domain-containing protein n=1 Tax=Solimicrobium silvestre TaxID=2099400 RepID=A0A2S9GXB3_9BURK|nr:DUF6249 domain-containing protein [Solimicrobium silvestre]PRC92362.1 hypothetical protein S2091_3021 [Solimicrobium silvestre]
MYSNDSISIISSQIVPIVAIIMSIGTPVAIVMAILHYKAKRNQMLHETIQQLAQKGLPIPRELLNGVANNSDSNKSDFDNPGKKSALSKGIILIAIGIGMSIMFYVLPDRINNAWGVGMIPLLMGIGYLLIWKLENRDQNN